MCSQNVIPCNRSRLKVVLSNIDFEKRFWHEPVCKVCSRLALLLRFCSGFCRGLFWGPSWQCLPEAAQRHAQGVPKASLGLAKVSERGPETCPRQAKLVPRPAQDVRGSSLRSVEAPPKTPRGVAEAPQGDPRRSRYDPEVTSRR